ncbi:unnamed protein product [Closterium sp. Yama58-4]|nr:unnamed protein product [Closterium sp. Yama58-4]
MAQALSGLAQECCFLPSTLLLHPSHLSPARHLKSPPTSLYSSLPTPTAPQLYSHTWERLPGQVVGAGGGAAGWNRPAYCVENLVALITQAHAVQQAGWQVSWGWCGAIRCFLFVFPDHNRIILEAPEYGKATYFFELEAGVAVRWQLQRLLAVFGAASVSRIDVITNLPLEPSLSASPVPTFLQLLHPSSAAVQVGVDLSEEEAGRLERYGWVRGTGIGELLNFCDRLRHDYSLTGAHIGGGQQSAEAGREVVEREEACHPVLAAAEEAERERERREREEREKREQEERRGGDEELGGRGECAGESEEQAELERQLQQYEQRQQQKAKAEEVGKETDRKDGGSEQLNPQHEPDSEPTRLDSAEPASGVEAARWVASIEEWKRRIALRLREGRQQGRCSRLHRYCQQRASQHSHALKSGLQNVLQADGFGGFEASRQPVVAAVLKSPESAVLRGVTQTAATSQQIDCEREKHQQQQGAVKEEDYDDDLPLQALVRQHQQKKTRREQTQQQGQTKVEARQEGKEQQCDAAGNNTGSRGAVGSTGGACKHQGLLLQRPSESAAVGATVTPALGATATPVNDATAAAAGDATGAGQTVLIGSTLDSGTDSAAGAGYKSNDLCQKTEGSAGNKAVEEAHVEAQGLLVAGMEAWEGLDAKGPLDEWVEEEGMMGGEVEMAGDGEMGEGGEAMEGLVMQTGMCMAANVVV